MPLRKILNSLRAVHQLGLRPSFRFAFYQTKLRSGLIRLQTPVGGKATGTPVAVASVVRPAEREEIVRLLGIRISEITDQATEIMAGKVRLFGAEARPLMLGNPEPQRHWAAFHSNMPDGSDIKPVWEVGRFGWATVLARAYWLSGDEAYAETIWNRIEEFVRNNPVNSGPHWSSGQEVALRLISWAFCYSLIENSKSSTNERRRMLAISVEAHAERIPPTLDYAFAQNNNHLLSEGLGLATAAALLPAHPQAGGWRRLGTRCFTEGIERQIHEDGAYAQHSTNYQRLMLQLACWARVLNLALSAAAETKIAKAATWLGRLVDKDSGEVPNLGPNDSANALPFSVLGPRDFRPALQTASLMFCGERAFDSGTWDEKALWLGANQKGGKVEKQEAPLRMEGRRGWATMRTARFGERPGHADQLHVDLWWRGMNVVRDAGTYVYTGPEPWDNGLASGKVHNAMIVDDGEPMTRAGRFLWLDWAQAKIVREARSGDGQMSLVAAEHDGYKKRGVGYTREMSLQGLDWTVRDSLVSSRGLKKRVSAQLNWLVPDWKWAVKGQGIGLESPEGVVTIEMQCANEIELTIFRAGEVIHGAPEDKPTFGWFSPTYGVKLPALSLVVRVKALLPLTMATTFSFPE